MITFTATKRRRKPKWNYFVEKIYYRDYRGGEGTSESLKATPDESEFCEWVFGYFLIKFTVVILIKKASAQEVNKNEWMWMSANFNFGTCYYRKKRGRNQIGLDEMILKIAKK